MTRPVRDTPFADRLATARRVIAAVGTHRDELRDVLGVWRLDQHQAAAHETDVNIQRSWPLLRRFEPDRWADAELVEDSPTTEQSAMLLAVLLGCTPCPHLRRGEHLSAPRPIVADLNHRLVVCRRCAQTRRRVLDDDRCEVCGQSVPDRQFQSFVIAANGVTYIGNAGDCCAPALLDHHERA